MDVRIVATACIAIAALGLIAVVWRTEILLFVKKAEFYSETGLWPAAVTEPSNRQGFTVGPGVVFGRTLTSEERDKLFAYYAKRFNLPK